MRDDLEPITPREAVDLYLEACDDTPEKTTEAQNDRLRAFVTWCDEEGIANLNELAGCDASEESLDRHSERRNGPRELPTVFHGP